MILTPQPACKNCQGTGTAKPGSRSKVCGCSKPCKQCDGVEKTAQGACAPCRREYQRRAGEDWARSLVAGAQYRTREKGLEPVTIDHRWVRASFQRQGGLCFYLQTPLDPPDSGTRTPQGNPWQPSLDRVSNDKGYTPDNTRITSWLWNRMRNTMSLAETLACVDRISSVTPFRKRRDLQNASPSDQTAFVEHFLGAA